MGSIDNVILVKYKLLGLHDDIAVNQKVELFECFQFYWIATSD